MAFNERSDNNRSIHAGTIMGDQDTTEGSVPDNSLSAAPRGGWLGTAGGQSVNSGFQNLPDPDLHMDGQYNFQLEGVKQQMYWDQAGRIKDDNYPDVPNVSLPANGTTNMGPQGSPVDWASVAPDTYPATLPGPKSSTFPLLPRV